MVDLLSRVFLALSDPTRRAILERLAQGTATVGDLAAPFEITAPAISRHLKVLEQAGLVRREKDAQWRRCSLNRDALAEAAGWIVEQRRLRDPQSDALSRYVERARAIQSKKAQKGGKLR